MMLVHGFDPVYNADSRILILGSFPSVKSREVGFYYGNPQNRFWRVLASVFGAPTPVGIAEKRELLLSHGIALWDVAHSCEVDGSSDVSIRSVTANELSPIFERCDICRVFTNGKTAERIFRKYYPALPVTALPSTSPANAAWSFERLCQAWRIIIQA